MEAETPLKKAARGCLFGLGSLLAILVGVPQPAAAEGTVSPPQSVLDGAELVGKGPISVWWRMRWAIRWGSGTTTSPPPPIPWRETCDPALSNARGPNSSIMAYGRFNQVAQPGDGITTFYQKLGPNDFAAIEWGYGIFGKTAAEEEKALAERAKAFSTDRELYWSASEMQAEIKDFIHDPRVQRENTGDERIDATQLGVANILRSLSKLDEATGGNDELYTGTLAVMIGTQKGLLD